MSDSRVAPGFRVRVLLEWYDPEFTPEQAEGFATVVTRTLIEQYPAAQAVAYVEPNPPCDELL